MRQSNHAPLPGKANAQQCMGLVIAPHEKSYPDPLAVKAGDTVSLNGKEDPWNGKPEWTFLWCVDHAGTGGWVPKDYIDQQGSRGIVRQDYDCVELAVTTGETVTMGAEVSGWVWCVNQQGQRGWVPLECLRRAE